jgi:hypothetical protein
MKHAIIKPDTIKPAIMKTDNPEEKIIRPWYYYLLHNSIVDPPLYKTDLANKNKPIYFITKDKTKKIYCKTVN